MAKPKRAPSKEALKEMEEAGVKAPAKTKVKEEVVKEEAVEEAVEEVVEEVEEEVEEIVEEVQQVAEPTAEEKIKSDLESLPSEERQTLRDALIQLKAQREEQDVVFIHDSLGKTSGDVMYAVNEDGIPVTLEFSHGGVIRPGRGLSIETLRYIAGSYEELREMTQQQVEAKIAIRSQEAKRKERVEKLRNAGLNDADIKDILSGN